VGFLLELDLRVKTLFLGLQLFDLYITDLQLIAHGLILVMELIDLLLFLLDYQTNLLNFQLLVTEQLSLLGYQSIRLLEFILVFAFGFFVVSDDLDELLVLVLQILQLQFVGVGVVGVYLPLQVEYLVFLLFQLLAGQVIFLVQALQFLQVLSAGVLDVQEFFVYVFYFFQVGL
jgi:hypothetical protein